MKFVRKSTQLYAKPTQLYTKPTQQYATLRQSDEVLQTYRDVLDPTCAQPSHNDCLIPAGLFITFPAVLHFIRPC